MAWATSSGGCGSNLFALFQPQSKMAGLFRFAVAFPKTGGSKQALSWLAVFWLEIIIANIPGGAFLVSLPRALMAGIFGLSF